MPHCVICTSFPEADVSELVADGSGGEGNERSETSVEMLDEVS